MARNFNGSSDVLVCSAGGLSAIDGGPITIAFVIKFSDTNNGSIIYLRTSGGALVAQINGDGGGYFFETTAGFQGMGTAATADNWHLFAVTKANGSATPRSHRYVYDTNTWSHTDAGGTMGDSAATVGSTGTVQFARYAGTSEYFAGDIAIAGVWDRVLTDTEVEQLGLSLIHWHNSTPVGLWLFDQESTSQPVLDLTGNGANQSSVTGTAISSDSVPVWTYGHDILVPHSVPASGTNANAEAATASGTAETPTAVVSPPAVEAAATAAGQDATASVSVSAECATATATAETPTGGVAVTNGTATAVATAHDPSVAVATPAQPATGTAEDTSPAAGVSATVEVAAATASALNAAASTTGGTSAFAECATAVADAHDPQVSAAVLAELAAAVAQALAPVFETAPTYGRGSSTTTVASTGRSHVMTAARGAAGVG